MWVGTPSMSAEITVRYALAGDDGPSAHRAATSDPAWKPLVHAFWKL